MKPIPDWRINALLVQAEYLTIGGQKIRNQVLLCMCQAFEDRSWIGQFTYPSWDPRGKDERILALCMAAAILA